MEKKFISLATIVLLLLGSCSSSEKSKQSAEEKIQIVKVESVEARDVNQLGNYTATVDPAVINNISASTPNRIKNILVDVGSRVSAGQRLVIMDDVNTTTYQIQLDNAKAALKNAEVNYKRAAELLKIGGGTKQQVDQMEIQLINAKNAVSTAERTLRNMRENTILTSPISGVVTARNYDPGDITAGTPILTVARIQPVKIVINVTESELSKIKRGMPALITFDTYGDELFNGTVSMISPTVDPASRTFNVEITSDNRDSRILPGMFGRVQISLGTSRRVVVPDKSIIKQPGSGDHYIYIVNADNTLSYKKVELGQRLNNSYELISGVEPGSRVVISSQAKLKNGAKVKIAK